MDPSSLDDYPVEHPQPPGVVNYAFLNHSTTTLPNNLPPDVDDKPLARQRRKRTSPEDQAVLEAAYKRDPKPDKTARLELVKQVTLGEKEVQIWFQNRRQSSRRKSRPLLPHEIAQYQLAKSGNSSSPVAPDPATRPPEDDNMGEETLGESDDEAEIPPRQHEGKPDEAGPAGLTQPEHARAIRDADRTSNTHDGLHGAGMILPRPPPTSSLPAAPTEKTHHLGYLANRRSAPSLRTSHSQLVEPSAAQTLAGDAPDSKARLQKSSSFVRLSMSVEGSASVLTKDGSSPSPPRASQSSVISTVSNSHAQLQPPPYTHADSFAARESQKRSSSGRSRDSRTWEFWCDKDARSELEEKAEKDISGSAADAIGLLRSASGRSILGSLPAKRNSTLSRPQADAKRTKLGSAPSGLRRSSTSAGRLQGKGQHTGSSAGKVRPKLKYSESAVSVYIPGNDSDKENWSPERDTVHSGADIRLSGDVPDKKGDHGLTATRQAKTPTGRASGDENVDPEADPELAAFMRKGRKSNSLSSEDDMDCVQGLLSLSQGNWR